MNHGLTEGFAPSRNTSEAGLVDASSSLPLQSVDRVAKPLSRPKVSSIFGPLIVCATLGIAGWFSRDRLLDWVSIRVSQPTAVTAFPAIEKIVSLGRIEPEGEVVEVAGPSGSGDARVQSLAVDVGDSVESGDVLAMLDNHEQLRTQLMVAQTQLELARIRLEQSRLVASTTYAQLAASLETLKSQRDTARSDLRRQDQLRLSKASSEQEYEAALLAFASADNAVTEAIAKLARYTEPPENSVDVQVAQADVRVAEASLQNASAILERSLVRAPNAGKILDIDLRPGERIGQQALLRMGRTDSMFVRAEVYESDIAKIRPGQSATIHAIALNSPLTGIVEKVTTVVQRQSIVDSDPAANTDARIVEVFVRMDPQSVEQAARFVGMQVRVEFQR
jgi:HlyD family secretion protein